MSYPRQMIGNRGMTPYPRAVTYAHPHASPRVYAPGQQQVFTRSLTPAAGMGAGNPYGNFGEFGGGNPLALQPAAEPEGGGLLSSLFGGGGGGATDTAGGGGGFNVEQIKAVIDKLGGVEGIVETFNKMQKMVQSVQQFAPMLKVLFGSFGKKDAAASKSGGNRSGRRRRRRRGAAQNRRRARR
ncbi:hypothetical protein [Paenibacillus oleatilyticus]|uniref:hypothetical protein n=1 Tax=Paenibacillus oleatilyticus TaxID=2594886 RepID=UPI001C1FE6E3|nr:hypothetical protein [Paenibacillus oleatilyticus]MBU7315396.1 hypothetical protein [Paenibacillus oleatilyticus]